MERGFTAALTSAFVLHAALVGVSAWCITATPLEPPLRATAPEIEVTLLAPDRARTPEAPAEAVSAAASSIGPSSPSAAHLGPGAVARESVPTATGETEVVASLPSGTPESSVVAADGPGAAGLAPSAVPHRPIDLGLDGSIVARSLRETQSPPSARRPGPSFDGWSEGILRGVAHNAAPREGSALLVLEWDAEGRIASVRSSAESSDADGWRRLAASLKGKLAQRPQAPVGRLRLVYLVKSEVVKPGSRSKLAPLRNVSAEQLRDEHLPPAVSLNVGVKADTTPTGQRVVSVTLSSSQVL